jgi:hypothetical protein
VNLLLQGLLNDLLEKCNHLIQEVRSLDNLPAEVKNYQTSILERLSKIESDIRIIQSDHSIGSTAFTKNYLRKYKRLAERLYLLEWGPVLALSRFSERDTFSTRVCKMIAEEINYPYAPPLCVTLSSNHYFTYPHTNIIMIPVIEPSHLLGLPDLYHEMGHNILFREGMMAIFLTEIDNYYNVQIEQAKRDSKPRKYVEFLRNSLLMWRSQWSLEFASDLIATYVVGPAYAWANIRLCVNLSHDIFASDPEKYHTHPSDDARNEGVCSMLEKIGVSSEKIVTIRGLWNQFIDMTGESKPQDYELRFPPVLIGKLRDYIYDQCVKINLVPYTKQKTNPGKINVTLLLNRAWDEFNSSPAVFSTWEATQITALKSLFEF